MHSSAPGAAEGMSILLPRMRKGTSLSPSSLSSESSSCGHGGQASKNGRVTSCVHVQATQPAMSQQQEEAPLPMQRQHKAEVKMGFNNWHGKDVLSPIVPAAA